MILKKSLSSGVEATQPAQPQPPHQPQPSVADTKDFHQDTKESEQEAEAQPSLEPNQTTNPTPRRRKVAQEPTTQP